MFRSIWVPFVAWAIFSTVILITMLLFGIAYSFFQAFLDGAINSIPVLNIIGAFLLAIVLSLALTVSSAFLAGLMYLKTVAICKLSQRIGKTLVMSSYFVSVFLIVIIFALIFTNLHSPGLSSALLSLAGSIFTIPFLLFWYIIWKAANRCRKIADSERLLSAELYSEPSFSNSSLSRTLGLPFSIEHVKINRTKVLLRMLLSSLMYSVFTGSILVIPGGLGVAIFTIYILVSPDGGGELGVFTLGIGAIALLSTIALPLICLFIGARSQKAGRDLARNSLSELQQVDLRAPILFLRSFSDDQVALAQPRSSILARIYEAGRDQTLDILLLEEGTNYGPVVALGNPQDPIPPYGAARGYFKDCSWQDEVKRLAAASSVIVICLDDSPGLMWEIDQIAKGGLTRMALFLVHPRHSLLKQNRDLLEEVANRLLISPEAKVHLLQPVNKSSETVPVLGFFVDGDGVLRVGVSSTFSHFAFLIMLRLFFRTRLLRDERGGYLLKERLSRLDRIDPLWGRDQSKARTD